MNRSLTIDRPKLSETSGVSRMARRELTSALGIRSRPTSIDKVRTTLLAILAVALFPGCATIMNGSTEAIEIDSSPNGATALIDGNHRLTTPGTAVLTRWQSHEIVFDKDGYGESRVELSPSPSAWLIGNLPLFGVLGIGVDILEGSYFSLPEHVDAKLIADPPPAKENDPSKLSARTRIESRVPDLQRLSASTNDSTTRIPDKSSPY